MLLRSTPFSFQIVMAALVAGAGVAAGCSAETTSADFMNPSSALEDPGTSSGGLPQKPVADASAPTIAPYLGNALCHIGSGSCMPDDDVNQRSSLVSFPSACVTQQSSASDAAAPADGAPDSKACRIGRVKENDRLAPTCFDVASLAGGDGTTCEIGEDCAPGFDCIAGERGMKRCRHYCCAGTCKGRLSNGSATFCDVQSLVDVPQKAPVCMPLKRCNKLLGTGECSPNESCTVVGEGGEMGCTTVGDQQVGQPCDDSHCAAKLTCLGQPGARKCFKLCKVTASDCPNMQSCVTSAAFQDPDFGICQ